MQENSLKRDVDPRSVDYIRLFPEITNHFTVTNKIGEGTFASVFCVRPNPKYNLKEKFALKLTIPTVEVKRIENELRILLKIGGVANVIGIHSVLRIRDHIFILMPFINHEPFIDYYLKLSESEILEYMWNLLRALEQCQKFSIIHRDVKPNNFLVDRVRHQFALVDFGLAHSEKLGDLDGDFSRLRQDGALPPPPPTVLSGSVGGGVVGGGGRSRIAADTAHADVLNVPLFNPAAAVSHSRILFSSKKPNNTTTFSSSTTTAVPASSSSITSIKRSAGAPLLNCVCGKRIATCLACRYALPRLPPVRHGGTVGYRPPEVMLRCPANTQTCAIDVWAAGIILLTLLTGRYPIVGKVPGVGVGGVGAGGQAGARSIDDLDVLHTMLFVCGYERMQNAARAMQREIVASPLPSNNITDGSGSGGVEAATPLPPYWKVLKIRCAQMRAKEPRIKTLWRKSTTTNKANDTINCRYPADHEFPDDFYKLLAELLDPNPNTRIRAPKACQSNLFKHRSLHK